MSDSSFSKGFLLGALIGAGVVFFMGTKKGQELREEILARGEEFLDQAEKMLDQKEETLTEKQQMVEETIVSQQEPVVESAFAHLQMVQEQGRIFGRRFFHRHAKAA